MNFDEFWHMLSVELKTCSQFKTLSQSKTFEARMKAAGIVTITPKSTGISRHVGIGEFQTIWDLGKNDSRRWRSVSVNGRYSEFRNPVYVWALIDHIVGDQDMS